MRHRFFRILLGMAFSLMTVATGIASEPGQGTETDKKVLTVGLFKYVPDIQAFETALTAQWKAIEPDVALRFVDWDCYFEEPKSDVFVFDGLYASQYIEKGLLYPLGESIPARSAYPAWTLEQASSQGIYYGIPQMVCMDTLFYRKDDQAVARVQTMQQLYDAIGPRKTQALLPGRDEGVIADFSLNNEMKYYNILQDHTGKVVPVQAMGNVQEDAMPYLKELYAMTGTATGRYDDGNEFTRAEWFAQGHGRALYAYPEAMSAIVRLGQGDDTDVKAISSCEHPDVATAYVDYVSISSRIPADKVEAAKKLAALLTSKPYMLAALKPASKEGVPQYLLAARQDVMQELASSDPNYQKLYRHLYRAKSWHVMAGTKDFAAWEAKVGPDIERDLKK